MKKCKIHGELSFEDTYLEYSNLRKKEYERCKLCAKKKNKKYQKNNLEVFRLGNAKYRKHNKSYRIKWILYDHKITEYEYNKLSEKYAGLCAICNNPQTRTNRKDGTQQPLFIDHDHETDEIRGMLCNDCNRGLGFFKDNFEILDKASAYLKFHKKAK